MRSKKFFAVLFVVVLFAITLTTLVLMMIFKGDFTSNFSLHNSLRSLKTLLLDTTGVQEYDGIYRAEDRLIRVAGPINDETTLENIDVVLEVASNTKTPVYFSLVPTAEYIERASLDRRSLVWEQGEYIESVYYRVIEETNVIDITEILQNYADENIYFKTSDRLSPLGGYYIFQTVMRRLDYQVEDVQKYDIEYYTTTYYGELSNVFVGTGISDSIAFYRYPLFQRDLTMRVTDAIGRTTVYDDVYVKDREGLDAYIGGENPLTVISNTETFSEKLLVLSDNTFNVAAGFFVDYFGEITVVNPLTNPQIFSKINMDDYDAVLILFSTNTFNEASIESLSNMVE